MKKIMVMSLAACLITFAACGGKGDNNTKKESVKIPESFVQYDNDHFTISYPGDMKVTYEASSGNSVNMRSSDNLTRLDASFSEGGTSVAQLAKAGEYYVSMMEGQGWQVVDKPVVKDNIMKLRLQKDGTYNNYYVVSGEGSHSVSGSLVYPEDKAEEYNAYVAPLINSIVVK